MSTADLKKKLISRISNIDDDFVLEEVQRLMDFELSEDIFKLKGEQKERIVEAKTEFRNGDILTDGQANNEIQEWLDK